MGITNVTIDLKASDFEALDGRLFGMATILGTRFHIEGIPVEERDGLQVGVGTDAESRLNGLAAEFDAPGFDTINLGGRDYVLVIIPFGR